MQRIAEGAGFSVVTQYVGHGIGRIMHENPQVPNFVNREMQKHDFRLEEGLVLAVEPMVNMGRPTPRRSAITGPSSRVTACPAFTSSTPWRSRAMACTWSRPTRRCWSRDERPMVLFPYPSKVSNDSPLPRRCSLCYIDGFCLRCGKCCWWSPTMKVRASVKRICENCKLVRRHGRLLVICSNPRHKQRQG